MSAFVQAAAQRSQSSVVVCAFPANNTAGNCLVVAAMAAEPFGGLTTMTIADSQGNAWTQITSPTELNNALPTVWIAPNCKAGLNTVTVTYHYGSYPIMCAVVELTGIAANPLDAQNAVCATSAPFRTAAVTTPHPNDVLLLLGLEQNSLSNVETNLNGWPVRFSALDTSAYPPMAITVSEGFAEATGAQSNEGINICSYGYLYLLALQTAPPPPVVVTHDFPLRTDFPPVRAAARNVIVHTFGSGDARTEQRFYIGPPATRYTFSRRTMSNTDRAALVAFWRLTKGCTTAFRYSAPNADQTFSRKLVCFENAPLTLDDLVGSICSTGVTFVEVPDPNYVKEYSTAAGGQVTRFPNLALADALLDPVQEIIPLVRLRVLDGSVPDLLYSDRQLRLDGALYLPRLLRVGDPGSEVLMTQTLDGSTDSMRFAFGNADRAMSRLAIDTDLLEARIELSIYHVGSGVKVGLWAGKIVDWNSDTGPEFQVAASDILSALTLSSPVRNCSRSCWRRYGLNGCPATPGTQALDLVHFPAANANSCDLGFDTANGCLAHSGGANPTIHSFGGIAARPQKVSISDNSTGLMGFARKTITPTSQVNDSLWGAPLPEIWHNDDGVVQRALPVKCSIAVGREESDFYIALGAVGVGPLGAFSVASMVDTDGDGVKETFIGSTLDGQPHHGWKVDDNGNPTGNSYGLRQALGTDPAGSNDFFSIGRVGATPINWREVSGGGSMYENTFAAGVAFCEIRRVDQKGIQLSTPQSHEMYAMISQGLTGRRWTAPGTAVDEGGMTNPFWVAVNTFLRAIGLAGASASTQQDTFDVGAAIAAAAIADASVASLLGGGSEKQFRFKGVVDASKPTRDWLRDILNNGLGYFLWSFGRLKLGCRISATPATTFHKGNMLFGSLKMQPVRPQFEKLTVTFADEEYLFAKNTVDYTDQDHAARANRVQNPLASEFGLAGCSTKSQALRIGVTRGREELGGVGQTEQTAARIASWRTTILALDTEAGMVVSLSDVDLAGGIGDFRIQSWSLNRDWSVDITARTVTASMYQLTSGFVPGLVGEAVQPAPAILPGQDPSQAFTINGA